MFLKKKNQSPVQTFGYTPDEYTKFKKNGWRLLLLYSLFYATFYCIRLNLSNASSAMIAGLGLSKSDIGVLTATLFWTYAAGMLIGGRASEIFGSGRFIAISTFASVIANILFGLVESFPLMIVIWGINGFFQSLNWPAGCTIMSSWWPGKTRGFAIGFASALAGFGQALTMVVVALSFKLFPSLGYKSAFFFPAVLPVVFFFIFLLFTKESPEKIGLKEYKEEDPEIAAREAEMKELMKTHGNLFPYKMLFTNLPFMNVVVMHIFGGIARYGLLTWVPLYFIERYEVNIMESLFVSLALPIGMGIGGLIIPTITDKMKNRLKIMPFISISAAACIIGFIFLDPRTTLGLVTIEVLLFMAGFLIFAIVGILNTLACDYGGRTFSATANGIYGFSGYLGAGLQSIIYGAIVNNVGWNMVFFSIGLFLVICALQSMIKWKKKGE